MDISGEQKQLNERKQLKIALYQSRVDEMEKSIDVLVSELDKKSIIYSEMVNTLKKMKGIAIEDQQANNTKSTLPDVGDNTAVWDRMANAHKKLNI